MAEHETISEARESRINEAVQFFDDEFQRVQKELSARRKSLETEFASKRKTVQKRSVKRSNSAVFFIPFFNQKNSS